MSKIIVASQKSGWRYGTQQRNRVSETGDTQVSETGDTHVFPLRRVYRFLRRGAVENDAACQFYNRPNAMLIKSRAGSCRP